MYFYFTTPGRIIWVSCGALLTILITPGPLCLACTYILPMLWSSDMKILAVRKTGVLIELFYGAILWRSELSVLSLCRSLSVYVSLHHHHHHHLFQRPQNSLLNKIATWAENTNSQKTTKYQIASQLFCSLPFFFHKNWGSRGRDNEQVDGSYQSPFSLLFELMGFPFT